MHLYHHNTVLKICSDSLEAAKVGDKLITQVMIEGLALNLQYLVAAMYVVRLY